MNSNAVSWIAYVTVKRTMSTLLAGKLLKVLLKRT